MEQLTAIVYDDVESGICVGYKDVSEHEFWVRGHMPGMPLMPGVVMCEAAAQMCSYHSQRHNLLEAEMIGFGGMDRCALSRHGGARRSAGGRGPEAATARRRDDPLPLSMLCARAAGLRRSDSRHPDSRGGAQRHALKGDGDSPCSFRSSI